VKEVEGMRRQERLAAAELETPKASAAAAAGRGGILTRSRLAQTARGPARTYSLAAEAAAAAAAALPTPRWVLGLAKLLSEQAFSLLLSLVFFFLLFFFPTLAVPTIENLESL
jgi:hypothetical protein